MLAFADFTLSAGRIATAGYVADDALDPGALEAARHVCAAMQAISPAPLPVYLGPWLTFDFGYGHEALSALQLEHPLFEGLDPASQKFFTFSAPRELSPVAVSLVVGEPQDDPALEERDRAALRSLLALSAATVGEPGVDEEDFEAIWSMRPFLATAISPLGLMRHPALAVVALARAEGDWVEPRSPRLALAAAVLEALEQPAEIGG